MSQHNLDDQLREHYARKQLDAVKLRALEAQLACAPRRWAAWGWAAAAAAACVLVFWGLSAREGLAGALADEIARNHDEDLTIECRRYSRLLERMPRLDFDLREPRNLPQGLQLVGARYCSLQGRIAAQIKLVDEQGRRHTLYEVRDGERFRGLEECSVPREGLRIRFWREDGLVLGLASPD